MKEDDPTFISSCLFYSLGSIWVGWGVQHNFTIYLKKIYANGNYEKWNITIIQINVLKNVENVHGSVT